MAPKSHPSAAKQDAILNYLQASRTCHTLRDLEKALPPATSAAGASVSPMQVKDFLSALVDDGRVRVERIGSGNWYWSWASDEKRQLEAVYAELERENDQARRNVEELMRRRDEAVAAAAGDSNDEKQMRIELAATRARLETEVVALREELRERTGEGDGGDGSGLSARQKEAEIGKLRAEAVQWTDNIYVLEGYVRRLAGGDEELVAAVQRECYGDEYVEGEGLRELDE